MCQVRLSRCLQLLTLLQSRVGYSTEQLAQELGVSCRTVYRDLRLLKDAEIPILFDPQQGGHIAHAQGPVPLPRMTVDEWIALFWAGHLFALSSDVEIGSLVHQALGKLMSQAPAAVRKEAANLLGSVKGKPPGTIWPDSNPEIFATILKAIRQQKPLRIVYHQPQGAPLLRTKLAPCRLSACEETWHLIGHSSWHRKVCNFDVRRIQHAEQAEDVEPGHEGAHRRV
jgi:predicted DNA-binding transcriptional regulator YafY